MKHVCAEVIQVWWKKQVTILRKDRDNGFDAATIPSSWNTMLSFIISELWINANPTVSFMVIDIIVLYIGIILYIIVCEYSNLGSNSRRSSRRRRMRRSRRQRMKHMISMIMIIICSIPIIGPGSSCAFILSYQEKKRVLYYYSILEKEEHGGGEEGDEEGGGAEATMKIGKGNEFNDNIEEEEVDIEKEL